MYQLDIEQVTKAEDPLEKIVATIFPVVDVSAIIHEQVPAFLPLAAE